MSSQPPADTPSSTGRRRAARPIVRLAELWTTDAWLTTMVGLLVVGLFVVGPLFAGNPVVEVAIRVVYGAVLVAGVLAVTRASSKTQAAAAFCILTALLSAVRSFVPSRPLAVAALTCNAGAAGWLAALLTGQIFRARRISRHQVTGAVGVYLLLGTLWAFLFELLEVAQPGSIRTAAGGPVTAPNLFYFSFVTLTTLGYGDVIAVAPLARSAAVVEALVGQLYPAILIARLVSMEVGGRGSGS